MPSNSILLDAGNRSGSNARYRKAKEASGTPVAINRSALPATPCRGFSQSDDESSVLVGEIFLPTVNEELLDVHPRIEGEDERTDGRWDMPRLDGDVDRQCVFWIDLERSRQFLDVGRVMGGIGQFAVLCAPSVSFGEFLSVADMASHAMAIAPVAPSPRAVAARRRRRISVIPRIVVEPQ